MQLPAPRREFLRDLDELPSPAWDLVDVERYRAIWIARHGYFSMHIATTRGCPFHCNWCAKPIYGQRYTVRGVERVVDEMLWLKSTYRPDHLWIADDIFGLKPVWIERFAALVVERGAAVPFKCLLRADQVTAGNPLFYVLADRPNPTRYDIAAPGVVTSAPVQREIVGDLERAGRPLGMRWDDPVSAAPEPNAAGKSSGVTILDDYLHREYRETARFGNYVMLERR